MRRGAESLSATHLPQASTDLQTRVEELGTSVGAGDLRLWRTLKMEISSSNLRYATGVALRTPVDLQQLFRACGAMPLGAMLVPLVQDGSSHAIVSKEREGRADRRFDDFSRTAAAAGVPSHPTVLTVPTFVLTVSQGSQRAELAPYLMPSHASKVQMIHPIFAFASCTVSQKDPSPSLVDRTSRTDHHQPHQPRQPIGF